MTERLTAAQFKEKPKRAKPRDLEGPIQRAIVAYLRDVLPDAIVHHCKNEINRSGYSIAKELAKAKEAGAVAGFPDLIVMPWAAKLHPFFFEVKSPRGYPSKAQKAVHAEMTRLGYRVAVVRSIDDVRDCLKQWGVGFVEKIPHRGQING